MFFRRWSSRALTALAVFGGLVIAITFTPAVRAIATAMDQSWYDGDGEVLVVLGGSMLVPGTGPDAALGYDTYLRCVYAAWILKGHQHFTHCVVSGGGGLAQAMARFLTSQGIATQSIWQENAADSTYENALYAKRLLAAQYGAGRLPEVVVLTSDFHSWRARRTFEHCGLHTRMIPIPDVIKRCASRPYRWSGAITLLDEAVKDLYYAATGKI